jgi:hypothetical protein
MTDSWGTIQINIREMRRSILRARVEALSWARTERCCCRPEDCEPEYWRIGEEERDVSRRRLKLAVRRTK